VAVLEWCLQKVEAFREEIEKVVFQYVPTHKRLGTSSFNDLISFKKESIDKEVHHLIESLSEINVIIIALEDKQDPEYRKTLISKKGIKEEELSVHIASKPLEMENPLKNTESSEAKAKRLELDDWIEKKGFVESEITNVNSSIALRTIAIEEVTSLKRDIENKVKNLSEFIIEKAEIANNLKIDLNTVVKVDVDYKLLDDQISLLSSLNITENSYLDVVELNINVPYEKLNLTSQLELCTNKITLIQAEFSGEQAVYQKYLEELRVWDKTGKELLGDKNTLDSLENIKDRIDFIDQRLIPEIEKYRGNRLLISRQIFNKKSEIKNFYDEIKFEINSQLSSSKVTDLEIASTFHTEAEFKESILRNILQNKAGSFYGSLDGSVLLQESLISIVDWNNPTSINTFLISIIEYLENDKRVNNRGTCQNTFIGSNTRSRIELYNYLFSLSYLNPFYDLQQNGKELDQLSPGEKGALLLVFYLVLDKEDIPLIIDQPEDNLDNNSVAKVLVPFIREAKKKRQIILVTHNPNLAVVSDSEQIIRVSIDKENGNVFDFISGGIEKSAIKDEIVNVLEGTIPAFTLRKDKYQII
jgi:hypothetical protein